MKRFVLVTALALAGCSSVKTVPAESVAALPLETRLDLLEAENELFIAVDTLDDARTKLLETRDELSRAGQRQDEASDAMAKAKEANDAVQLEVAALAIDEAKARRRWLAEAVDIQREELRVEEANLTVARARYERRKAQAVKGANAPGAEKLELATFDAQVQKLEAAAKAQVERAKARKEAAEKVKSEWAAARKALSARSGGGQGSPWVE